MMKIVIGTLALVLAFLGWWFWGSGDEPERSGEDGEEAVEEVAERSSPIKDQKHPVRLIEGNPFISDYGNETGSAQSDLKALRNVVRDCQLIFKDFDRYHLPGNSGIIGFLQGNNPDRLAWIPPGDPFVNEDGELLDRFGEPVFFHRLSGMSFEYRSAGPDRQHWTDDDIVVK